MFSRKSAFTLVEILTVLVIIGIASAVVIPQLGTRDDIKVASAARTLTADLIYAQNLAISQQKYIYIRFDVANNNYKLLNVANSSGDTLLSHPITQKSYIQQFGAASNTLSSVSIQSVDFDGVDSTIADEFTLAFDEMGAPFAFCYDVNKDSEIKNGVIVLKSGGFTATVTVQPYTGEILVQ
jgi:prepilin-type N-terminal cleavage/methylation domain-containing protein